jgi:hypothetical protein
MPHVPRDTADDTRTHDARAVPVKSSSGVINHKEHDMPGAKAHTTILFADHDEMNACRVGVQDTDGGNLASVVYDGLSILASADGANTLAAGFELLAAKVRTAHREWLAGKAAEGGDQ